MGIDTVVGIGQDRNNDVRGKSSGQVEVEIGTSTSNAPDCGGITRQERRDTVSSIKHPGE